MDEWMGGWMGQRVEAWHDPHLASPHQRQEGTKY